MKTIENFYQADLEEQAAEVKAAEERQRSAMADAARLADELRQEQEHTTHLERQRKQLESQV